MDNILLLFRSLRYLTWKQIIWRVIYRGYQPRAVMPPPQSLREPRHPWSAGCVRQPAMISATQFCFQNAIKPVATPADWNNPDYPKLWLYHLHYFDDLCSTQAPKAIECYQTLIERWILENPAIFAKRSHRNIGWEPYPISRRMPNWIKWHLTGHSLSPLALSSLAQQAAYLDKIPEYHILGNHLLANAKALVFAGLFFEGALPAQWYKKGMAIYRQELATQILADGGHVEQSPLYHALILEDLLDVIQLHQIYNVSYPDNWLPMLQKMQNWLALMTHPDGHPAFFNDTVMNVAPKSAELMAYAAALGVIIPMLPMKSFYYLNDSGYVRIKQANMDFIADIGSCANQALTGHLHADTLSFELSIAQRRVFVNSGISTYALGPARTAQRSTVAHNTLTINQDNSSEVWHAFRCAKRAKVEKVSVEKNKDHVLIRAQHDGYQSHPAKARHQREWHIYSEHIKVIDQLTGQGMYPINLHLHCHPDFYVIQPESHQIQLFHLTGTPYVQCFFPPSVTVSIQDSDWYPEFGLRRANKMIVASGDQQLPCQIEWFMVIPAV